MVKAQLSIDYIIVFSFVLIIFVMIFGLVATQRVEQAQQQNYAQLQVLAQTIAQDINTASSLGNGYAQNVSLPSSIGLVSYNLSITSSGTVIVYNNATGKLSYAYAYAPVGRIISSPQYESPNSIHTYNMPIASGLIYLQNSHGDICIDYVCNTTSAQASGLNVYTKVTHVAQMNGQDSYIYVANSPSLLQPFVYNAITMSAWVYVNNMNSASADMPIVNYGTSQQGSYCFGPMIYVSNNNIYGGFQNINRGSSEAFLPIKRDTWYFVAWTYSDATNQLVLYVNGIKTIANGVVPLDPASYIYNLVLGSTDYTYNSGQGACQSGTPFNGSVSNLQIYSTALNSNQINQLQNGGINGAPVSSDNLSAWWPLNGNTNDYSGNGNDGRAYYITYPTVAQIYANVTNATLSPVRGDLVGFSSTLGSFEGNGQSTSNFTNNNGIATAFLMQTNNTGYADVKVTPFEGNVYTAKNLSGWWPLNTNQGNVIFNFANSSDPGALEKGYWNNVNYVGQFSGHGGYVDIPNSANIELYNTPMTISLWVSPSQASKLESVIFKPNEYGVCIGNGVVTFDDGSFASTSSGSTTAGPNAYNLSNGKWYNMIFMYIGNSEAEVYVNGAYVGYLPVGLNSPWAASANTLNMVIGSNQSSSATDLGCPGSGVFDGRIANVQLYKGNLTANEVMLLYSEGINGAPMTNINGVINEGWWPLNGNTNDYSGNNGNGFGVGSFSFILPGVQQSGTGNANEYLATNFTNPGSYVKVNTINNYADILTTGSFTLTAWIYYTENGYDGIAGNGGSSSGFEVSSGPFSAGPLEAGGQYLQWPIGTYNLPLDKWEMVTAEYNGTTGEAAVYLDNASYEYGNIGAHLNLAQSLPFYIGAQNNFDFGGSIANVQLYSVPLSKREIDALYNSGIYGMPRPNDGLVGWWPLNGNANDYSGNGNNGVDNSTTYEYLVNPSKISSLNGYGVSSLGAGNAIVANNRNYPHFSIASWVYLDQPVSGSGAYLGTPGGSDYGFFRTSSKQGFLVGGGSATSNNVTTFPIGKWTYVVGTFDGHNVSYYADGVLLAKGTSSSGISSSPLVAGPNLAGSIANIEYYNVSLTSGQVYQLYNSQLPITYNEQIPLSWGT